MYSVTLYIILLANLHNTYYHIYYLVFIINANLKELRNLLEKV